MPTNVLVLDTPNHDLAELVRAFATVCAAERGRVRTLTSAEEVLHAIGAGEPPDLLVVDQELGDGRHDGLSILARVREVAPDLPAVVVAAEGNVDAARLAIEAGATDFLVRGSRLEDRVSTQVGKIRHLLRLASQNRVLFSQNLHLMEAEQARYHIVGRSPQIRHVVTHIAQVARVPRPVLVQGERGTGKELVARAVHVASSSRGPFIAVNCGSLVDSLVESELFGHERGAYTGADRQAPGKLELAAGGTLFLDEIGNMSLPFQRDLLRVAEYRVFTRVGGSREIPFAGRIVAATNADLRQKIERGEFLADLYDRIAFEVIQVPPLRDREGDVEVLASHFLDVFIREVPAFRGKRISSEALALLGRYHFPGNVRELKTIIERAMCRDSRGELTAEDLGLVPAAATARAASPLRPGSLKERVAAYERQLVLEALDAALGNQAEAARRLGLSYHQMRYFARKYSA
jgi:DNA-binding NtrC family response regulator